MKRAQEEEHQCLDIHCQEDFQVDQSGHVAVTQLNQMERADDWENNGVVR